MLLACVTYQLHEENQGEFMKAIFEKKIAEETRKEEGNVRYDFMLPAESKADIFLFEIWRSPEDLEFHRTLKHFFDLQDVKAQFVKTTDIKIFEISDTVT